MKSNYVWKIAGFDHPFYMKVNKITKEIMLMERIEFDILKIFQQKLHFRYEFVHPISKNFFRKYDNGTSEGVLPQIINQDADMSYAAIPITSNIHNLVDYSTFVNIKPIGFIAVRRKWPFNWDTIPKPFSFQIWIAIFVSILLVGFVLAILIQREQKLNKTGEFWTLKKSVWYLFGSLTGKGTNLDSVNRFPSRFILGIWLLSVVILASSYSQILISFMTAPIYEEVPKTFHQLATAVEAQRFSCGAYHYTAKIIFKHASSKDVKILKDHIKQYDLEEIDDIIKRIQSDRFAFISAKKSLNEKIKIKLTGRVVVSEDSLLVLSFSYLIRKGFPYKQKIDKIVAHLFEAGITDHLGKNKDFILSYVADYEVHPLSLEELSGIFFLLVSGYILSIICFIVEIIKKKKMTVN